jgi:hypothetical protein
MLGSWIRETPRPFSWGEALMVAGIMIIFACLYFKGQADVVYSILRKGEKAE